MEKENFELLGTRQGENAPIKSQLMQLEKCENWEEQMWPEHVAEANCMTASWGKAKDMEA